MKAPSKRPYLKPVVWEFTEADCFELLGPALSLYGGTSASAAGPSAMDWNSGLTDGSVGSHVHKPFTED